MNSNRTVSSRLLVVALLCALNACQSSASMPYGGAPKKLGASVPVDLEAPELATSTPGQLRSDLEHLTETIGERHVGRYDSLVASRDWLVRELEEVGYAPTLQTYVADGKEVSNVIVEITGSAQPDEIVVVGAHYDTAWGTPGADDNGTGTVAALALARAASGTTFARTLRVVFFTNEEPPFFQTELMGSLVYAKACKAEGDDVVAMLSLEMLGFYSDEPGSQHYPPLIGAFYPDEGNYLAFIANPSNGGFNERVHALFEQASALDAEALAAPEAVPGIGFSDQWSFWQVGYPGVMVTDTAFMRNHHYHEESDTVDTIDFERFAQATNGIVRVTSELASGR